MGTLHRLACSLLLGVVATAHISPRTTRVFWPCSLHLKDVLTKQVTQRQSAGSDKNLVTRLERTYNGDDMLVKPLAGPVLPYFDNIAFDSPCLDTSDIRIFVDTGSSDFWIDSSMWCSCEDAGKTVASISKCNFIEGLKSEQDGDEGYWIGYEDGFQAYGKNINGNLMFGEKTIKDIDFMVAWDFRPLDYYKSLNKATGMVGLGYIRNQQVDFPEEQYPTLPHVLEQNGNTTSNAFSMWFEATEMSQNFFANIMFGGYVSNFFQPGALQTFQILSKPGYMPSDIVIRLDEIGYAGVGFFTVCTDYLPVLLDSGSFSSYLPYEVFTGLVQAIAKRRNVRYVENELRRLAVFDNCDEDMLGDSLLFRFGLTEISLPLRDIIRPVNQAELKDPKFPEVFDVNQCISHGLATYPRELARRLGDAFSSPSPEPRYILGITFLRYIYAIYDLSQSEVAIAPIDQEAIKTLKPDQFIFYDGYGRHETWNGYDQTRGTPEYCPVSV